MPQWHWYSRYMVFRPTYSDIARLAEVGTATVERVLNGRGNVRPEKVEQVLRAARALRYPRLLPEVHHGIIRVEVMLVRPDTGFYERLARQFERIAASLDSSISIHRTFVDELAPEVIARQILKSGLRRSALIISAPIHPKITEALARIKASGQPVIQVVSRSAGPNADFVGIDNYLAGRTAAMFMSRMQRASGKVVAVAHSQAYGAHRDRVRGFSDYFRENPNDALVFTHVMFGRDEHVRSASLLQECFRVWPDIVGIYNSGGANPAVISVIEKQKTWEDIFFVGHELTPITRAALRSGRMEVVIDQSPEAQARRSIDLVLARLGWIGNVDNFPIPFVTYAAENV